MENISKDIHHLQSNDIWHEEGSISRSLSSMLKPYMSEESLSDIALEGLRGSLSSSDFSQYKHTDTELSEDEKSTSNLDIFLVLTLGAALLL
ncbi:hypothetical protein K7432_011432 [Basidiobolus ranarum]|uniref:Uncharacterized protein n=1 Tax=Basidiobolus ranarum TaxID=34480 RepID=A0ABR2VU96_9FUNG